jgi:hypothetical protein
LVEPTSTVIEQLAVRLGGVNQFNRDFHPPPKPIRKSGPAHAFPSGEMLGIESQEVAAQGSDVDAVGHFMFGRVLAGGYEFKLTKPVGVVLRSVRCGGEEVTPDSPLRVGDSQKVTGFEVLAGREDSAARTEVR